MPRLTPKEQHEIIRYLEADKPAGRRKLTVKVVDIFGNDTMTILEVTI